MPDCTQQDPTLYVVTTPRGLRYYCERCRVRHMAMVRQAVRHIKTMEISRPARPNRALAPLRPSVQRRLWNFAVVGLKKVS